MIRSALCLLLAGVLAFIGGKFWRVHSEWTALAFWLAALMLFLLHEYTWPVSVGTGKPRKAK